MLAMCNSFCIFGVLELLSLIEVVVLRPPQLAVTCMGQKHMDFQLAAHTQSLA
jgi:hypothetical protein